jgi:hypothetical protein
MMKNETRTPHPRKEIAPARAGRCIALIDSNYMAWLVRQSPEANAEPENYNRAALLPTLAHALKQAGLNVDVQRVYWYTDTPDNQFPQDQILRQLDVTSGEPSDVVLQAMSADISRLAERHACEHLLIASDDDRLTSVVHLGKDVSVHQGGAGGAEVGPEPEDPVVVPGAGDD